jgi:hypothetical protein
MDGISADKATRILDADFQNIVKKVAAGKTLTSAERARIESRAAGASQSVAYANSYVELGTILGVTRRTLSTWKKREGAPQPLPNGQHDVSAWREFIRSNGLKGSAEPSPDTEALKARRLLVDIEDRELRLEIKRGHYLHKEEVKRAIITGISQLFAILHKRLEDELPPVSTGKDAIGIRQENARALDEARRSAQQFFEEFLADE